MTYRKQYSAIDETTLKEIASITGGRYFRATDSRSLEKIYAEIDTLEKTEIDIEHFTQYQENFSMFVVAGLLCLGVERILGTSRLGRLPQ